MFKLADSDICAAADSIYFDNDRTLFATFKYIGTDFEADMKNMASLPKMREWWAMTDEMQVCCGTKPNGEI